MAADTVASCDMTGQSIPRRNVTAIVFTAVSVAITILWQAFPTAIPSYRWNMPTFFVCCGVVLLSCSRFHGRHAIPMPEFWLIAFPFVFGYCFDTLCPTTRLASVDELLWRFDAAYGYPQPGLARLLISSPLLFWTCRWIWWSLPCLLVVQYLALPDFIRRKFLVTVVGLSCIILPLYALCPGTGPIYLLRERFLSAPVLLHPHSRFMPAGLPLNTTPSGHVAWVILLFWFSWVYCRKPAIAFFGLTGIGTVLATLGSGEHYVIDLVLSFPLAAGMLALVGKQWKRSGAMFAAVIIWLVALREGWAIAIPVPLVWLLSVVTVLVASMSIIGHSFERAPVPPEPVGSSCLSR